MQSDSTPAYNFTQQELDEYRTCPELLYNGGHLGGHNCCPYCVDVFKKYRRLQKEEVVVEKVIEEEPSEEESQRESSNFNLQIREEENGECTKLECMKAGWCMCE